MSENVAALIKLEQQLRSASGPAQLFYTIVNETHQCLPYTQAVLFAGRQGKRMEVVAASDLPTVDHTSPFVVWIERLFRSVSRNDAPEKAQTIDPARLEKTLIDSWSDFSPPELLWVPLKVAAAEGEQIGALLLFRESGWKAPEVALIEHLAGTMAHAMFAWQRRQPVRQLSAKLRDSKVAALLAVALFGAMWLPVRLSTLAPVEVIPKAPVTVAAPINGAVRRVLVEPNQQVQAGEPLVELDDTELASELNVASQALLVARAELKTVRQSGFLDPKQKARLAELETQVQLRQAEQAYARSRYEKAHIAAPDTGIAVLGDPDRWQGRPVSVGERILQLADPDRVELEIMLPVKDAITLQQGAEAKIFLDSDPLNAWSARVEHAEYKPGLTAEEILSYRLVAEFSEQRTPPRIGSRGTAKVYGEEVTLFFYLFRRPVTSVRQWIGW